MNGTVYPDGIALNEAYWKQVSPSERVLLMLGRVDMLFHFDANPVANDGFADFFDFGLENNVSIPFPTYGGFGGILRVQPKDSFYAMLGVGDSSNDQPFAAWESAQDGNWWQILELGLTVEPAALGQGHIRVTPWHNHLDDEDGWGVGLNLDQQLGLPGLTGFFRFGIGDPDVTGIRTLASGGLTLEGPFGRKRDMLGVGAAWTDPSPSAGFRDSIRTELFYRVQLTPSLGLTPTLQVIVDPPNDPTTDVIWLPGLRLALTF